MSGNTSRSNTDDGHLGLVPVRKCGEPETARRARADVSKLMKYSFKCPACQESVIGDESPVICRNRHMHHARCFQEYLEKSGDPNKQCMYCGPSGPVRHEPHFAAVVSGLVIRNCANASRGCRVTNLRIDKMIEHEEEECQFGALQCLHQGCRERVDPDLFCKHIISHGVRVVKSAVGFVLIKSVKAESICVVQMTGLSFVFTARETSTNVLAIRLYHTRLARDTPDVVLKIRTSVGKTTVRPAPLTLAKDKAILSQHDAIVAVAQAQGSVNVTVSVAIPRDRQRSTQRPASVEYVLSTFSSDAYGASFCEFVNT